MQLRPSTPGTSVMLLGEDGTIQQFSGTPQEIGSIRGVIHDDKQATVIRSKQNATDSVLRYSSRILDTLDRADTVSGGKLGGLASSGAVWGKVIGGMMDGPRATQFNEDVKGREVQFIQELANDPEAATFLEPGLVEKLSEIGADRTEMLSNIIGLGYATAKTSDPGGRISNADLAFNIQRIGMDLDAWLNDPAAVRRGVLEVARDGVASYETTLRLSGKDGKSMVGKDQVLNEMLPEYGFNWTGGVRGKLTYGPGGDEKPQQQQQAAPAVAPQPAPGPTPLRPREMSLEQLQSLDPSTMSPEMKAEAADRWDALSN